MSIETIMGIIAVAGPSIRAGEEIYEQLRTIIARARSSGTITQAEQDALMERVNRFRVVALTDDYEPHWKPKA